MKVFADRFAYVKHADLVLLVVKNRSGCESANAFFMQTSTAAILVECGLHPDDGYRTEKSMLITFVHSYPEYSNWCISRRYVMMPNTKTSAPQVMDANAVKSSRKIVLLVDQLAV